MSADERSGTAERERLASTLVLRSGRLALEHFHRAQTGQAGSAAAAAGLAIREGIVVEIGRAFPHDAIVAEEGGLSAGLEKARYRWVLSLVNGADDFDRGMPGFTISIGVLRDGMPFAGAVYDPITRWLFTAGTGRGAWLNDRPLRVAPVPLSARSLIAVRTPRDDGVSPCLEDWLRRHRLRRFGSTALHLCYAALGGLDLVHDDRTPLSELAAAAPVLLEAGGVLTLDDGAPLFPLDTSARDGQPVSVLAGNRLSHAQALSLMTVAAIHR
jgi:myo-inositol-1(or 4)-monophosphatase